MALGEFELIDAIRERLAAAGAPAEAPGLVLGSGDDAAIRVPEGAIATSVDALVEGVHFRLPPFAPADVGHKALASALSDLAAMGARAVEAYVQLGVRDGLGDEQLLELADGLGALAAEHAVVIAGGDVVRAPALLLAVTAVGEAPRAEELVRRSGGRPGDVLAVTGELGGAAAGLRLLERPELGEGLEPATAATLRSRQLRPQPRLAAGAALAGAGAKAMIDVSDGLGADAGHLARASGLRASIDVSRLPTQAGVDELAAAAGVVAADLVLGGGEDYELLAALAPGELAAATEAVRGCGLGLTPVGTLEPGEGVELSGRGADAGAVPGFDQLRSRAPDARA